MARTLYCVADIRVRRGLIFNWLVYNWLDQGVNNTNWAYRGCVSSISWPWYQMIPNVTIHLGTMIFGSARHSYLRWSEKIRTPNFILILPKPLKNESTFWISSRFYFSSKWLKLDMVIQKFQMNGLTLASTLEFFKLIL